LPGPAITLTLLQSTGELSSTYWLGLSWDGTDELWNWADGDDAGNGEVLNAYPYAHWWVASCLGIVFHCIL
jgi:hypothetical protein